MGRWGPQTNREGQETKERRGGPQNMSERLSNQVLRSKKRFNSVEEARRVQRTEKAKAYVRRHSENDHAEQKKKQFQNLDLVPRSLPSSDELLKPPPFSPRFPAQGYRDTEELCRQPSLQIALQNSLFWTESVRGVADSAQSFSSLVVCVHSLQSTFTSYRQSLGTNPAALRELEPSLEWTHSFITRSCEEAQTRQVITLNAQIEAETGMRLLAKSARRHACLYPQAAQKMMALLGQYKKSAAGVPFSCTVRVHGVYPYCFIRWPPCNTRANPDSITPAAQVVMQLQKVVEERISQYVSSNTTLPAWLRKQIKPPYVVGCRLQRRSPLKGLSFEEPFLCVQMYFAHSKVQKWFVELVNPSSKRTPPQWDWDRIWNYSAARSKELDAAFRARADLYGRDEVQLLNANVDPEVQVTTDYQLSGRRSTLLRQGSLRIPTEESVWSAQSRSSSLRRTHLTTFAIDVHCSHLAPVTEARPLLPLKVMATDIEAVPLSGGFPNPLRGDPITHIALNTSFDLTNNHHPALSAYVNRTVFCLGETSPFLTVSGEKVRVVSFPIAGIFLYLLEKALLTLPMDPAEVSALLKSMKVFLKAPADRSYQFEGPKKWSRAEEFARAVCQSSRLVREYTEEGVLKTPPFEWGGYDWDDPLFFFHGLRRFHPYPITEAPERARPGARGSPLCAQRLSGNESLFSRAARVPTPRDVPQSNRFGGSATTPFFC